MGVRIKKKNEEKVWVYLQKAIQIHQQKTPIRFDKRLKLVEYEFILADLIEIDDSKSNNVLKRGIIDSAIRNFAQYKRKSINRFVRCLEIEYKKYKKKTKKKYYIIFPINIRQDTFNKRWINLLGTKIKVHSYRYISRNFDFEGPLGEELQLDSFLDKIFRLNRTRFSYLVVEKYAINSYAAVQPAFDEIERFRSILNFSYWLSKRIGILTRPKPLSIIQPSPIFFTFDEHKRYKNWSKIIGNFDQRLIDLESGMYKGLIPRSDKLIQKINSLKDKALREKVLMSISNHNNALDEYSRKYLSFLYLWQIFEIISLSTPDMKQETICRRISSLFKDKKRIADLLEVMRRKRNQLIHEGNTLDIEEDDFNIMLEISQGAIWYLLHNANRFGSIEALEFFYKNRNTNLNQVKAKKRILNHIMKHGP